MPDFQTVTKKLSKNNKKNYKKRYNVLKNSVPLHRFNKQLIVLQVKKKQKNEKVSIFVRSCSSCFFRFLW